MAGTANAREQDPKCKGALTAPALRRLRSPTGYECLRMNVFCCLRKLSISEGTRHRVLPQLRTKGSTALRT